VGSAAAQCLQGPEGVSFGNAATTDAGQAASKGQHQRRWGVERTSGSRKRSVQAEQATRGPVAERRRWGWGGEMADVQAGAKAMMTALGIGNRSLMQPTKKTHTSARARHGLHLVWRAFSSAIQRVQTRSTNLGPERQKAAVERASCSDGA
jgi:hypothetical protein